MTPDELRSAIREKYPDMSQTKAIEAAADFLDVSPRTIYRWLTSTQRPLIPLKREHLIPGPPE